MTSFNSTILIGSAILIFNYLYSSILEPVKNKIITIYDNISAHDKGRVIAHELAHFLWDSLNIDERDEYYLSSQWKKSEDKKTISLLREDVPIQDSYVGPHEDFSNNVELFLFQKESLSKNPQLIKYLEKIIR